MQRKPFLEQFRFILPIGLAILLISSPTTAQTVYSIDLVTASYIEANTLLPLKGDDACLDVPPPFPFPFYRKDYTHAYVSTNGFLSFVKGYYSGTNVSLPTTTIPNGAIYAFWDDLNVDLAASVRTELLGAAPNRRFVVEWRNVSFFGADFKKRVNFEIVLHENGVILLQYHNVANDGRQMGNSATIGVEDETGNSAVQFSFNRASLGVGEYAIRLAHLARSVPADIKPGGCPNPLNVGSKGVLPFAILGTSDLDVTAINPDSVTLGGGVILSKDPLKIKILVSKLRPLRWSLEDVGTPYAPFDGKIDPYQCNELGPDGYLDIVFKFDTEVIAAAFSDVEDREVIILQLRGQLRDGTEISGEDVAITKKGKGK